MRVFGVFGSIYTFLINYYYIKRLKDCNCSNIYEKYFIQYYGLVSILLVLGIVFLNKKQTMMKFHVMFIYSIISLTMLILYYTKTKDCKCSHGWERDFSIFHMVLYALFIVLYFMLMISRHTFSNLIEGISKKKRRSGDVILETKTLICKRK